VGTLHIKANELTISCGFNCAWTAGQGMVIFGTPRALHGHLHLQKSTIECCPCGARVYKAKIFF